MLSMAWREEMRANPPRRDGHVETVSQRHQCPRAASRNPVRQVPHHSPPGRSPRSSAKERVRAPVGKTTPLHQGAKIYAAVAQGEPHAGGPTGIEDFVARQQTAEHRLCSQGVLWTALELRARGLGTTVLRELARVAQMAEIETLREVRRHDRSSLGRTRRLLQARE